MIKKTLLFTALILSPMSYAAFDIITQNPYARATPPNAVTSAIFMDLINNSEQDRTIISATTSAANKVELHDVVHNGDIMQMRKIEQINIPAHSQVSLQPGSLHIMLFSLLKPLVDGDTITVELTFDNGEKQVFQAPVKKVMDGMKHHH
ncbi:copper chaperone PCu(A)C [Vibrio renipiscarius]|uniref:copper chaperone PCu(A)C n=1 Tax=Vibrio renipiscarius TaxID=1461322 RepID=UPI0035537B58